MQTVYSKASEEFPIKNGHLISCMCVDKRNNIYLAIGGDLYVYSLKRLSADKDDLVCIIRVADLIKDREDPVDVLTEGFNMPSCSESIAALVDSTTRENKLMVPRNLASRIVYLNSRHPHIVSLSLSQIYTTTKPAICLTLNDRTMLLLRSTSEGGYEAQHHPNYALRGIRLAQYLWDDVVAILTHRQLIVAPDSMNTVLLDSTIHDGALAVQGCQTGKDTYLMLLLYPGELFIANASPTGRIVQETIRLPVMCDFLRLHEDTITVGCSTTVFRMRVQSKELTEVGIVPPQKMLWVDGNSLYGSENISQLHNTRAVGFTTNKLVVAVGSLKGGSHKQCDLFVQAPECFDLLRNCLLQLASFQQSPNWSLNFCDIRLLRNKSIFGELIDTVLVLHDSSLVEGIRNVRERKLNAAMSQNAAAVVESLKLRNPKVLVAKLLINLLLIVRKEQMELLEKLLLDQIQEHIKKLEIHTPRLEPGQVFKRCVNTLQKLGSSPVIKCRQCKLFRINTRPQQFDQASVRDRICFVCWGQLKAVVPH